MRILIVDDELNIRKTLRIALEAMKHAVDESASVSEALRQFERAHFDVAFVDLKLGEESGFNLLEALGLAVSAAGRGYCDGFCQH